MFCINVLKLEIFFHWDGLLGPGYVGQRNCGSLPHGRSRFKSLCLKWTGRKTALERGLLHLGSISSFPSHKEDSQVLNPWNNFKRCCVQSNMEWKPISKLPNVSPNEIIHFSPALLLLMGKADKATKGIQMTTKVFHSHVTSKKICFFSPFFFQYS